MNYFSSIFLFFFSAYCVYAVGVFFIFLSLVVPSDFDLMQKTSTSSTDTRRSEENDISKQNEEDEEKQKQQQ
jgi:hypothetical protein